MGKRRTLIASAAVAMAAIAGLGVFIYASSADNRAEEKVDVVEAFVASASIAKGTSGDVALAQGLIRPARVLRGSVPSAAVTDGDVLRGRIASSAIDARQFITNASFVEPSEAGGGSLAALIASRNLVAVTVSVDAERGVANQIAPGDRVDVAVVNEGIAAYILRNVKVLAVGSQTPASASGPEGEASTADSGSGLITFEISPEDALAVVAANKSGTLYLMLLPIGAGGAAEGGGDSSVPAADR